MAEYIEREAALAELCEYCDDACKKIGIDACAEYGNIMRIPAANVVEVRHGVWFWRDNNDGSYTLCCSACLKTEGAREEASYCPNCGADMRGEKQ